MCAWLQCFEGTVCGAARPSDAGVRPADPQVGIPSAEARLGDALNGIRDSTASVREFLAKAGELRSDALIADTLNSTEALAQALAKTEAAQGGAPLLFSDAKGMAVFAKEVRRLHMFV